RLKGSAAFGLCAPFRSERGSIPLGVRSPKLLLQGLHKIAHLADRLLVLLFFDGVRDNSTPSPTVNLIPFTHQGANGYVAVQLAAVGTPKNAAAISGTAVGLKFLNNFHRPLFRRAGYGAAGKRIPQHGQWAAFWLVKGVEGSHRMANVVE